MANNAKAEMKMNEAFTRCPHRQAPQRYVSCVNHPIYFKITNNITIYRLRTKYVTLDEDKNAIRVKIEVIGDYINKLKVELQK